VAREQINFNTEILIVDDDEQIRSFIRILDINMPGADGMSLLRLIREKYPKINVVMCSGDSTAQNVKEAIAGGAVSFLAKPVLAKNLMNLFDKLEVPYKDLLSH